LVWFGGLVSKALEKSLPGASELGIFHTVEFNMIRSAVWLAFNGGSTT
jgi:hypothetical protein